MKLLDANIFLRYLTRDDEIKAESCRALFERLSTGEDTAMTTEVILHEVLFVLSSRAHYALSHEEAAARLRPLLLVQGLRLSGKRRYLRALDIYANYPRLDFADAVSVSLVEAQQIDGIVSYDRGFDGVPAVVRAEP